MAYVHSGTTVVVQQLCLLLRNEMKNIVCFLLWNVYKNTKKCPHGLFMNGWWSRATPYSWVLIMRGVAAWASQRLPVSLPSHVYADQDQRCRGGLIARTNNWLTQGDWRVSAWAALHLVKKLFKVMVTWYFQAPSGFNSFCRLFSNYL